MLRIAASRRISGCAGVDLVVPVGPDQQQVTQLGLGHQVFKQVERRSIEPLQVIEEQRQRALRPSEDAEQAAEDHAERGAARPGAAAPVAATAGP